MENKGEVTQTSTLLLLLDWEKAFDKVSHAAFFQALRRLNLPPFLRAIYSFYDNPQSLRKWMDTHLTPSHRILASGKAAPISPYLF
eukprot:3766477-Prorocentrum_lima.AAC.1